jgi:pimeloyl-ACP methyl ester carboxylesterase
MTAAARVSAGGIQIAYSESGSGEPVILLHGGESGRIQYDGFRPLLGDGIRAIAYDQRDTGDSVNPPAPYGMEDHARDCAALIRGLGYERAHVFGCSYGGAIALQLGVTVPEVVQTLTAGATFSDGSGMSAPAVADAVALPPGQREQRMLDLLLSPEGQASGQMVAEMRAVLVERPEDADARRFDVLRAFDVTARLPEITAPTLLIYGENDPAACPEIGRRIAGAIPGARLEVIPAVRHGIWLERRDLTARLLREFVLAHPVPADA